MSSDNSAPSALRLAAGRAIGLRAAPACRVGLVRPQARGLSRHRAGEAVELGEQRRQLDRDGRAGGGRIACDRSTELGDLTLEAGKIDEIACRQGAAGGVDGLAERAAGSRVVHGDGTSGDGDAAGPEGAWLTRLM